MQFSLSYKQLRELSAINIEDVKDSSLIAVLEKFTDNEAAKYIVKDSNNNPVYTIQPLDEINYSIYEIDSRKEAASIAKTKTVYRPVKITTDHHMYDFKLSIRNLSIKMYKDSSVCVSSAAVRDNGAIHLLNTILDEEDLYLTLSIFFAVSLMYADSQANQ